MTKSTRQACKKPTSSLMKRLTDGDRLAEGTKLQELDGKGFINVHNYCHPLPVFPGT